MESYGDWNTLEQAFIDFANKVPFYGAVVACVDDAAVRGIMPRLTRRVITYGFEDADVSGRGMALEAFRSWCTVWHRQPDGRRIELGALRLRVPGRHNLLNALGAVAVGLEVGVAFARIAGALEEFGGAERRFQLRGEAGGVMVVDDYGHHPTEIAAVLGAARAGLDRRVVVVFQPHRYTRTRDLFEDFVKVLSTADALVLTEVYPAGELPIVAADGRALARALRVAGKVEPVFVEDIADMPDAIRRVARAGDVVVTMGAGSIGNVPAQLA